MKPRTLVPHWVWRLWFASLVVLVLTWLLLRGAWIYVRHGEAALESWFAGIASEPLSVSPVGHGGAGRE